MNSARKEFEEKLQDFFNSGTSNSNAKRDRIESLAIECESLGDSLPRGRFYERVGDHHRALAIFVANKEWERASNTADRIKGREKEAAEYLYLAGKNKWVAIRAERLGDIDIAMAMRSGQYIVNLEA